MRLLQQETVGDEHCNVDDHNIDNDPFHITFHVDYEKNSLDIFGLVIYMYVYSVAQIEKCPTCKGTSTLPT